MSDEQPVEPHVDDEKLPELPVDNAKSFELHMEEYKSLRAEILSHQGVRQRTFQLGIAAIVAIWAFLLSEPVQPEMAPLRIAAWWLPVPVAAAGLLLNYTASIGVKQAGAYLAMIEERYSDPSLRGWENTLIYMRETKDKKEGYLQRLIEWLEKPAKEESATESPTVPKDPEDEASRKVEEKTFRTRLADNLKKKFNRDKPKISWTIPGNHRLEMLKSLKLVVRKREAGTGYSAMIRYLWWIILTATVVVASLASILICSNSNLCGYSS